MVTKVVDAASGPPCSFRTQPVTARRRSTPPWPGFLRTSARARRRWKSTTSSSPPRRRA